MEATYRITGLDPAPFAHLFALSDEVLRATGAERVRVTEEHAAPCRISLDDAGVGESVILLSYPHQTGETPYRQAGPIFVREAQRRASVLGEVPSALARRMLSLRGYDTGHNMIEADLSEGAQADSLIGRFFANPAVAYIHAHYARRGCYAARIDRA